MIDLRNDERIVVADAAEFGRVAVMYGGDSSEREVSLDTGRAVLDALKSRGVDAAGWDSSAHTLVEFADAGFDRIPDTLKHHRRTRADHCCLPGLEVSHLLQEIIRTANLFGTQHVTLPCHCKQNPGQDRESFITRHPDFGETEVNQSCLIAK